VPIDPREKKTAGSHSKNAKLTEKDAQAILDARPHDHFDFRKDGQLVRDLAEQYGVSPTTVTRIWRRKEWTHLERSDRSDD